MSLFPRSFITEATPSSYHPLFRFFDEFDQYNRTPERLSRTASVMKFNPKFDVKELKDAYELHGEFPGVDQKDVEIEFTDSNTLTIKGRTERTYTNSTPPAGFIEGEKAPEAITEKGHGHKVTVEEEGAETTSTTEVATKEEAPKEQEEKYWVSERSVGEFSRSFSFPVRVDQDAVKASMKNGILSVVVPKAKKHESRKINIE
jgi:HSP20 family molecular chaperone IbpA